MAKASDVLSLIKKFLRSPLFIALIICGFWQVIFYQSLDASLSLPDTPSYVHNWDGSFSQGKLGSWRTPVYPLFIRVVRLFTNESNYSDCVAYVQKALFFLSIIIFYLAVSKLSKRKWLRFLLTLIYGCSPALLFWNVCLLTESLSIIEMVIIAFLTLDYLQKPRKLTAILSSVMIFIAIMTRPAMVFLLPVFLVFWIIKRVIPKKKVILPTIKAGLISCIAAIICTLGYCFVMYLQHGAFALSTVQLMNKTWVLAESGAYENSADTEKVDIIKNDEAWKAYFNLTGRYEYSEVERFVNTTISENRLGYYRYYVNKTIDLGDDNITPKIKEYADLPGVSKHQSKKIWYGAIDGLQAIIFPVSFGLAYILIGAGIIMILYDLFKKHTIDWYLSFFIAVIFCTVFISIFAAPHEAQRLTIASMPIFVLLFAHLYNRFIRRDCELVEEKIMTKKSEKKLQKWLYGLFVKPTTNTKIQFFRYLFVGGFAAVVNIGSLFVLSEVFKVYYLVASIIGFILGLITNYLLSRRFVFSKEKTDNEVFEFITYAAIGVIGLLLDTLFVWLFTEKFGLWYMGSKIVATGLVFIWNFVGRKVLYKLKGAKR